jgi:hypothetical protein
MPVEIRVEHGGGEVLTDPVLHDLHAGRCEPTGCSTGTPVEQVIDLLQPSVAIPPQRTDHAGGESAGRPPRQIGVVVVQPSARVHDRVLPGGDAERMQIRLPLQHAGLDVRRRRVRSEPTHQIHRPLVQRARGLAAIVALDPAVGRVCRVTGHAGHLQRCGVHPPTVPVAIGQEHGAVRRDLVERVLGRRATGEHVHRPPAAEDPRRIGVGVRVRHDRREVVRLGVQVVQITLQHVESAGDRMHVRVLEAGQQHPAVEVDHLGVTVPKIGDGIVRSDECDAAVLHGDGPGPPPRGVDRVHGAVHEDQVRRTAGAHRSPLAPTGAEA